MKGMDKKIKRAVSGTLAALMASSAGIASFGAAGVPVLHLGDDGGKILELVLVDLDHPEAVGVKLVHDGLDAGGFSCTGISK